MTGLDTGGSRSARRTTSVPDVLVRVFRRLSKDGLHTGLDVCPRTGIQRLLLGPDDLLDVRVLLQVVTELSEGEWVELFNTGDGDIIDALGSAVLVELGIHLTSADKKTLALLGCLEGASGVGGVGDEPLEVRLAGEIREVRAGKRVAEKCLGEEDDERLAELAVHLSSQDVEQICGGGHVGNLHVAVLVLAVELLSRGKDTGVFVAELEVSLDSARRVFGSLPVVTVGKRHYQTSTLEPFGLSGSDKLINDTLSVVGKITELRLPHDERIGRSERVSVLETKTINHTLALA